MGVWDPGVPSGFPKVYPNRRQVAVPQQHGRPLLSQRLDGCPRQAELPDCRQRDGGRGDQGWQEGQPQCEGLSPGPPCAPSPQLQGPAGYYMPGEGSQQGWRNSKTSFKSKVDRTWPLHGLDVSGNPGTLWSVQRAEKHLDSWTVLSHCQRAWALRNSKFT